MKNNIIFPIYLVDMDGYWYKITDLKEAISTIEVNDILDNEFTGMDSEGRNLSFKICEDKGAINIILQDEKENLHQLIVKMLLRIGEPYNDNVAYDVNDLWMRIDKKQRNISMLMKVKKIFKR